MSYDFSIGDVWLNYTSNLAPFFYDHIPAERGRGGLHELNGLTGKQACAVLSEALADIDAAYVTTSTIRQREKYDAKNGWGSTDGALIFLGRMLAACAANPRKKVDLSA